MVKRKTLDDDLSLDPSLAAFSDGRLMAEVKRRQRLAGIKTTFEREEKNLLATIACVEETIKKNQELLDQHVKSLASLRRKAEQHIREAEQALFNIPKQQSVV